MGETVNFIDEQDVAFLEAGQDSGEISLFFNDRTRSRLDARAHFVGYDLRQRGLAQPGETVKKQMIQRFTPFLGGADGDVQPLSDLFLTDIFGQGFGPDSFTLCTT